MTVCMEQHIRILGADNNPIGWIECWCFQKPMRHTADEKITNLIKSG